MKQAAIIGITMQKLYCYIDETGVDASVDEFLVSAVIVGDDRDKLLKLLQVIEGKSKKQQRKWSKANEARRLAYIQMVFNDPAFKGKLHYNLFAKNRRLNYMEATASTTALAIQEYAKGEYKATIIIDGLSRPDERRFSVRLGKYRVQREKIRGMTDEASEFIRLADAVCGFLREAVIEKQEHWQSLLERAVQEGYIVRVGQK